jgi:hypothetical protein
MVEDCIFDPIFYEFAIHFKLILQAKKSVYSNLKESNLDIAFAQTTTFNAKNHDKNYR